MTKAIAKRKEAPAPSVTSDDRMMDMLQTIISDPTQPLERIKESFAFCKEMKAEKAKGDFVRDMVLAQGEMEPIRKDGNNPQTRSRYATFDALDRAVRPIYTKYGFAPSYRTEPSEQPDHVKVVLSLMHISGHSQEYVCDMPTDGKGAKGGDVMTKTHAFGSAFSYGKRYAFGGAFNLVTTERDDDGNAAGGGDGGTITQEQIEALDKLITESGTDKAKFLAIGQLGGLEEMPASQYPAAVKLLKTKIKAAKKGASDAA